MYCLPEEYKRNMKGFLSKHQFICLSFMKSSFYVIHLHDIYKTWADLLYLDSYIHDINCFKNILLLFLDIDKYMF